MLLPYVARKDVERRVTINTIGPFWEGNQVWLILGAGAVFAAWPPVYAASFSGFYIAMFLVLATLILRPVGFKYRNKRPDEKWRRNWDRGLFVGAFVPSLVFGVAFGNLLQGVPFHFDDDLRSFYTGSFWALLNPFALVAGVLSVALLVMHGAAYLRLRIDGPVAYRAGRIGRAAAIVVIVLFALAGVWVATGIDGYRLTSVATGNAQSNPLGKTVVRAAGAWLDNYATYRWMVAAPVAGFAGAALAYLFFFKRHPLVTLCGTALAVTGVILTAGFSLFPFIMPSSSQPSNSLTAWDAVSSHRTLQIMFWVTVVMLPVITLYTSWAYAKMRGKIDVETVESEY